jgi:hypothetical protein
MLETQSTQSKIINAVSEYKRLFPEEFQVFLNGNRAKISKNKDKFGSFSKNIDYFERAILEYPETLFAAFKLKFTDDDWKFLDSKQGSRWFAKQFPEFKAAEKI